MAALAEECTASPLAQVFEDVYETYKRQTGGTGPPRNLAPLERSAQTIDEGLRRVEEAETDLTALLAEFMPVIGIITKAPPTRAFAEVQRLLPAATNVLHSAGIREELDDGHVLEPMGLVELVNLTVELFPEGIRRAFVAAQKADLDLKRKKSQMIVMTSATSAAGIGAIPIPIADAALIVPIQIAMIAGMARPTACRSRTAFSPRWWPARSARLSRRSRGVPSSAACSS